MMIIRRRTFRVIIGIIFFLIGFLSASYLRRPRIRLGEHVIYINYRAKINPKKIYHLKLWDYQWPGVNGENWYQPFIKTAVADFQKENPNIKVELRLVDFQSGPGEFSKALASGTAPDVYCSAYDIPEINYRWQIPVSVFLKPQELAKYYPDLKNLLALGKYQVSLPRWVAPGVWIGNRSLMEKAGLSVAKIQEQGWSWQDLYQIEPKTEPICIGNYSAKGFFPQLLSVCNRPTNGSSRRVLDVIDLINGPLPQKLDYEANMLELFLSGKTLFIGGVRPLVYDFIKRKAIEEGIPWEPVLLPVPSENPGKIILPVECGVVAIYRHKETKGDDQLAAAARLAYFISTYSQTAPWERLKVIPAVPEVAAKWFENLGEGSYQPLTDWLSRGMIVNIETGRSYQEEVYPGLKKYLSGKISRTEIESIITKSYFEVGK